MTIEGFQHGGYHVFPGAQQLRNEDGTPGQYYPTASVMRWRGDLDPLLVPLYWYDKLFATEIDAKQFAAQGAITAIEGGRIPF